MYSPDGKGIHVINPTAILIWELCDGMHTPEDMAQIIMKSFSGTQGHDISGEIHQVLDVFVRKGLVEPVF